MKAQANNVSDEAYSMQLILFLVARFVQRRRKSGLEIAIVLTTAFACFDAAAILLVQRSSPEVELSIGHVAAMVTLTSSTILAFPILRLARRSYCLRSAVEQIVAVDPVIGEPLCGLAALDGRSSLLREAVLRDVASQTAGRDIASEWVSKLDGYRRRTAYKVLFAAVIVLLMARFL